LDQEALVAKTKAQIEKRKRDTEKRKKLEKLILKLAAELPDTDAPSSAPAPEKAPESKG